MSKSKHKRKSHRPRSVTGRDELIVGQALYRFIATEAAKDECDQEWSNLQDARAILNAHFPHAELQWGHEYEHPPSLVDEKVVPAEVARVFAALDEYALEPLCLRSEDAVNARLAADFDECVLKPLGVDGVSEAAS